MVTASDSARWPALPAAAALTGSAGAVGSRLLPVGPTAVLLDLATDEAGDPIRDARLVGELAGAVREVMRAAGRRVGDVVPGARTVLVDGVTAADVALLADLLARPERWSTTAAADPPPADPGPAGRSDDRLVELPTVYDGADLEVVAGLWGVPVAEAVDRHTRLEFRAAFTGFAPGFAYLAGLPADWAVPRRGESRAVVPAGAVGLAGRWCGVYPRASPGGWQLVGHTTPAVTRALFDPAATPPALLTPGTRVRFVRAA